MNLLDRIKTYGTVCCVCGSKMSTDLNLESEFGNRHYFSLTSNSYPLEFKRFVPFSDQIESIYVNDSDDIKFPWHVLHVQIQSRCGHGHQLVIYFTRTEPWNSQKKFNSVRISRDSMMENIQAGEFIIRNMHGTTEIFKSGSKLIKMPLKDSTCWPLSNPDKLKEKINSLLLLK